MSVNSEIKDWLKLFHSTASSINKSVRFMEVCGTHTMALFETGLREALPENVQMLSGPGCPVCVTPDGYIDTAIELSEKHGAILATFGDMMRVPGRCGSLLELKSRGGDVKVVYTPLAAIEMARNLPDKQVVFLGVGFETTIPSVALAIQRAKEEKLENFTVLAAHKTIPNALKVILNNNTTIDGLMCPGHVSVIIGSGAYEDMAEKYHVPCVISGFETLDMLRALVMLLNQVKNNLSCVENAYPRAVDQYGNLKAQALIDKIFHPSASNWRGIGSIPQSGLELNNSYSDYDASLRFGVTIPNISPHKKCLCGNILKGTANPHKCELFSKKCKPETPVGPCMVSSEGTCAAYFKYSHCKGDA